MVSLIKIGSLLTAVAFLGLYSKTYLFLWNEADLSCGVKIDSQTARDGEDDQDLVFQYLRRQNQRTLFKELQICVSWLPSGGAYPS